MKRSILGLVVSMSVFCLAAATRADQVVLKEGSQYRPGQYYYGTTDTWMDYDNPTTNDGSSGYMYVNMDNEVSRKRGLIKFDLAGILPPNAIVQSATLSMYLWGLEDMGSGDWVDVGVYDVGNWRDWVETQATWNVFKGATYWSQAGCENAPWDRDADYRSTRYFDRNSATGIYYDWDVTASLQEWVSGQGTNNGLLLRGWRHDNVASEGILLGTRNASLGVRPRLTINYIPEPTTIFLLLVGGMAAGMGYRRPR